MVEQIEKTLAMLRLAKPLVLNITNYVTMDMIANSLLALGAAPLMTVNNEELEELVQISSSININIGTLDNALIIRCYKLVDLAKQYSKPIILDPVGAGASHVRTQTAQKLLEYADIVRGNASEIISLMDTKQSTFGVESVNSVTEAKDIAATLANTYRLTVVISGPIDFITDGNREATVPFGSPLMPLVTGMGCALTAVISAFRAIMDDSFNSAHLATSYFGLCGQFAAKQAKMPGSFRTAFIDSLYGANLKEIN